MEDIPDKALYAAILNYADSNGDGMIQKAEAAGIYFLSVYETVKDYTGLEYLTNLNSLFFGGTTDENGMDELLEKLSGLIIGQFTEYKEDYSLKKDLYSTLDALVKEYDFPICYDFPVGHVTENLPLINGAEVEFVSGKKGVELLINPPI